MGQRLLIVSSYERFYYRFLTGCLAVLAASVLDNFLTGCLAASVLDNFLTGCLAASVLDSFLTGCLAVSDSLLSSFM